MSYPQDIHRGELFTGVHKLSTGVSKGKVRGCIRVHSGTLRDHSGTLEDHTGITQDHTVQSASVLLLSI